MSIGNPLNSQPILALLYGESFPMREQDQNLNRIQNPLKKKYEFKNQNSISNLLNPYPNPANDFLYLPYKSELGGMVLIHDAMGKLIRSYPMQKGYNILKIESLDLTPGIYLLSIKEINGNQLSTKKITVQH